MGIAVEALPAAAEATEGAEGTAGAAREAAPWQGVSRASGRVRSAPSAVGRAYGKVSTPSAAAQTITKLIWAAAMGLIVLQVAAEATGQKWSFALPSVGRGPAPKQPYAPLYTGQAAAAMPAVFGGTTAPPTQPLSGRSSGNLGV